MYNGNQSVQVIADGLKGLSPAELDELDRIITPRAAVLLAKAFGPEIADLLGPLTETDDPKAKAAAEEELRRLMRDPRYWRDRDPAILTRVGEGFKRLYPDSGPAGTCRPAGGGGPEDRASGGTAARTAKGPVSQSGRPALSTFRPFGI